MRKRVMPAELMSHAQANMLKIGPRCLDRVRVFPPVADSSTI